MQKVASINRLKFCNFKLESLLEITQAINDNKKVDELLEQFENILTEKLNIGKLILFHYNNGWERMLTAGFPAFEYQNINVDTDLLHLHEISTTPSLSNSQLHDFDIVVPVYHNKKPMAYLLIGDIDEEQEGISPTIKHLHFIQTLTNVIMVAIENKRLFKENLEKERLKQELKLANRMQEMLVPDHADIPVLSHTKFSTYYQPHFEVGGDYFDIIKLDKDEVGFVIADVSGKGFSAALLMSNFQANLRALFTNEIDLKALVKILNKRVLENAQGEKFITLFLGKYNQRSHELNYINAGHNPPMFYTIAENKLEYLKTGCVGLGMLDEMPVVRMGSKLIEQHAKMLCFTDGFAELSDADNNEIEINLLAAEKILSTADSIDVSTAEIVNNVEVDTLNNRIFDDVTILGIEFLNP